VILSSNEPCCQVTTLVVAAREAQQGEGNTTMGWHGQWLNLGDLSTYRQACKRIERKGKGLEQASETIRRDEIGLEQASERAREASEQVKGRGRGGSYGWQERGREEERGREMAVEK
jgi:hypothetical protein